MERERTEARKEKLARYLDKRYPSLCWAELSEWFTGCHDFADMQNTAGQCAVVDETFRRCGGCYCGKHRAGSVADIEPARRILERLITAAQSEMSAQLITESRAALETLTRTNTELQKDARLLYEAIRRYVTIRDAFTQRGGYVLQAGTPDPIRANAAQLNRVLDEFKEYAEESK